MNEDGLPEPTVTARLMLQIIIYAALLLVVLLVGFIPIVSTVKISQISLNKMTDSSTPGHWK